VLLSLVFCDRATRTPLKANNNLQNNTQKTKDRATRTPLKQTIIYKTLVCFSGVRVALSLVFCVVFCRLLFVFSGVRVALSLVFCNTTQKTKDRATRAPLKQTIIYKALHRKLKIEQHVHH
jgi:hypothetical protein